MDSANAIQEGLDPEAEGPPVDDVCVAWGLILTSPLRAHRWDDAAADPRGPDRLGGGAEPRVEEAVGARDLRSVD